MKDDVRIGWQQKTKSQVANIAGDKTELIRELEQLKIELKMARKQNELYEEK